MVSILSDRDEQYTVEEGYSECATLVRTSYENFTVVSWLLPANKRRYLNALYAFCRYVDNLGDEYTGDRMAALAEWESDLRRCYYSTPIHPYMIALQQTIKEFDIPIEPFLKIIKANRMDQTHKRYQTFSDLEKYCQNSANPVGHLILHLNGYKDIKRRTLSDYICTALQLSNFWQDIHRDYLMGRIYIPHEDLNRFGCSEDQLGRKDFNDSFRNLMSFEVERTRHLFNKGYKPMEGVEGYLKLDVALYVLGGLKILDRISKQGYDVLNTRPTISKMTKTGLLLKAMFNIFLLRKDSYSKSHSRKL